MKPGKANKRLVWIIDTTLRDGEQMPGVAFSPAEKEELAVSLNDLGVNEIEAGIPAMGKTEINNIKNIMRKNLSCRITAWCRALYGDIDAAVWTGSESVHISFPTSQIHLAALGKDNGWLYENTEKLISYARQYFDFVSIGAQDATRTDINFLKQYVKRVFSCGADRLRLADTVGVAVPVKIYELIKLLGKYSASIEYHGHNDLGMATANSLTALQAGAGAVSVTVNGIGERAGNAPLEELAVAIRYTDELTSSLDFPRIKSVSRLVSEFSGIKPAGNKPIVGEAVFTHESGIHCDGLLKQRNSYQPFAPEEVGLEKEKIVLGKHSGASSVQYALRKNGIDISKQSAYGLVEFVREKAQICKRSIFESELLEIYNQRYNNI